MTLDPTDLNESAEDLYEHAPCAYLSTLPDGTIVKVNQTFLTWSGYDREALLGKRRFQDLLAVAGRIYHETHLAPLLRMQGAVNEVALELVCADQSRLPILMNVLQRQDAEGRPRVNRLTIFNARERREYERELLAERRRAEQAAQTKADFLSMISHEIRTPLGAIMGVTHLLDRTGPTAQQAKLLRILRSSSENLLNLVNEVLDFSRIEAGRVALDPRSFSLRDLVYETAHRLEVKAAEKQLSLLVYVDPAVPPWLIGDPGKLGQVLTNLLGNAIKFTSTGQVRVDARRLQADDAGCTVQIAVTDTGIGIPAERLETIFEAFSQASNEISTRYGGTGLGLAISQRLLALHDSRLTVESTLGKGSRFAFEVTLPHGTAPDAPDDAAATSNVQGVRVLVADDNPINVFVVSRCLEGWGVDFDVVHNGREALEAVQNGDYQVVLMDLQMPEMDGYEAARAIRNLPDTHLAQLPIIAVSASTRIGQQDKVALAGFTDFLGKPYEPQTLLARIARYAVSDGSVESLPPAPMAIPQPAAPPPFSFDRIRAHAEDESESVTELFGLVRTDLLALREQLPDALRRGDATRYAVLERHGRTSLGLLQATVLRAAIDRGARVLADGAPASARDAAQVAIEWAIDDIVSAMDAARGGA